MKNYLLITTLFISASLSAMESHERPRPRRTTQLSKTAVVCCLLMALPVSRADSLPQDNRELVDYDTWLVDGLYKPLILGDEYNIYRAVMLEFKERFISAIPSSGTCWIPNEPTTCPAYNLDGWRK